MAPLEQADDISAGDFVDRQLGDADLVGRSHVYDLAHLLDAATLNDPVPVDVCLEIALELAGILAAALETGDPPDVAAHGFLVPGLVLVSRSGEVSVSGYEIGPTLAQEAAARRSPDAIEAYRDGAAAPAAQDVFAAGLMLTHLLAGEPAGSELCELGDQFADGSPVEEQLADFLARSVGPVGRRHRDIAVWRDELREIVFARYFRATPQCVGELVHELCERSARRHSDSAKPVPAEIKTEIKAESDSPPVLLPEDLSNMGADSAAFDGPDHLAGFETPRRSPAKRWVTTSLFIAVAIAGALWLALTSSTDSQDVVTAVPLGESDIGAESPDGPNSSGPVELAEAVASATERDSDSAIGPPQSAAPAALPVLEEEVSMAVSVAPLPTVSSREPVVVEETGEEPRGVETPAVVAQRPVEEPATQQVPAAGRAEPSDGGTQRLATVPAPGVPRDQPAPVPPPIQLGSLVSLDAPGVVAPRLLEAPPPRFPRRARRLNKRGVVAVRVLVDASGHVTVAELESEPLGYGLDEAAIEAALAATYSPAHVDGTSVSVWTTIRFSYQLR